MPKQSAKKQQETKIISYMDSVSKPINFLNTDILKSISTTSLRWEAFAERARTNGRSITYAINEAIHNYIHAE